jgi:hypothetical protein
MKRLRIGSYFSAETDLAAEMRSWPEFVSGSGYDVDLRDASTGELVTVRYIESGEEAHVHITGSGEGSLFDRVAGRAIHAMSAHSDSLFIDRHEHKTTA